MSRPSHSSRFDHPKNIGLGVHIIKLLITILKHSHHERPSFTPIPNNRHNYSSVEVQANCLYITISSRILVMRHKSTLGLSVFTCMWMPY
jgi:hypothetical protein